MHKPIISACALVLTLTSAAVGAAPVISGLSASGGSFQDNVEVNITGSGFGSHSLDIAWLGGADGVIEAGASGRTPSNSGGWVFNQGTGCNMSVSTTEARSGSKTLYCNQNADNAFNAVVRYSHPSAIGPNTDIFVSWWVRRVHSGSGQWKMFRINHQNDIQDDAPQIVMFNWDDSEQFFVRTSAPGTGPSSWDAPYPKSDNRWYRLDFHVRTSSLGGNDGRYTLTLFDPVSGNSPRSMTVTGNTYPGNDRRYQWFLWQNYIGNGINSQQTWLDDMYIQVGTQARVELCDRPTWSSCTFREIQQPVSWTDGRITIKLNRGGFKPGDTAYLFVVDGSGAASGGVQITIGGTAAPTPAVPNPPTNLQVN